MGVERGGGVGVGMNGGMEVALCARWVRWLPMSPCAWSGVGPVTAMMLPLTVDGGCVVPGTVAGGCVVTGTVAGAAAAVVSASATAPASVAAVCSPGSPGGESRQRWLDASFIVGAHG